MKSLDAYNLYKNNVKPKGKWLLSIPNYCGDEITLERRPFMKEIQKLNYSIDFDLIWFVRSDQLKQYKEKYPEQRIIGLKNVTNLAETRKKICTWAKDKYDYMVSLDNDILKLFFGFNLEDRVIRHRIAGDVNQWFCSYFYYCEEVFKKHPDVFGCRPGLKFRFQVVKEYSLSLLGALGFGTYDLSRIDPEWYNNHESGYKNEDIMLSLRAWSDGKYLINLESSGFVFDHDMLSDDTTLEENYNLLMPQFLESMDLTDRFRMLSKKRSDGSYSYRLTCNRDVMKKFEMVSFDVENHEFSEEEYQKNNRRC